MWNYGALLGREWRSRKAAELERQPLAASWAAWPSCVATRHQHSRWQWSGEADRGPGKGGGELTHRPVESVLAPPISLATSLPAEMFMPTRPHSLIDQAANGDASGCRSRPTVLWLHHTLPQQRTVNLHCQLLPLSAPGILSAADVH